MTQYFIRLDDICPTMKRSPFEKVLATCRANGVTGILGVVPDNRDPGLVLEQSDTSFWDTTRQLADEGWIIAQHGYQHVYTTAEAGLLGLRRRSEFAGLPYKEQYRRISLGKKILEDRLGQRITWWMAPAHSFDTTTCAVLCSLGFTHITDGVSLYPFTEHGLTWVPHQLWTPVKKPFGTWTIGLHLNTISGTRLNQTLTFIEQHAPNMRKLDFTPRSHILNPIFRTYWYSKFRLLKQIL